MSTQQLEALRLADGNDECAKAWLESSDAHKFRKATAAELRRLHAANIDCVAWYEAIKADYAKLMIKHETLSKAVAKLHAARGRYHTQLAACDLYAMLDLPHERPTK